MTTETTERDGSTTLRDRAEAYRAGRIRPSEVIRETLDAAEAAAPLHYLVRLRPAEALAAAEASDRRYADGQSLGPLDGIPFTTKDNIEVAGEPTTAGSALFLERLASATAPVVTALTEAGAIRIGAANMHEVALGSTGDVSVHGVPVHPDDPTRMTGGSSSGSAGAVARGIVPFALGTDTGGSVRIPAALCGIVGMKPTHGLVSTAGVVELAGSFDSVGPLTRTVEDNALVLEALAGAPGRYVAELDEGVGGLVIGIPDSFYVDGVDPVVLAAVRAAADVLTRLGAEVRTVSVDEVDGAHNDQRVMLSAEAYAFYRSALTESPEAFTPAMFERLSVGRGIAAADLEGARSRRAATSARFAERFERIDALLTPTTPFPAPLLGTRTATVAGQSVSVSAELARLTAPSNYLGVPSLAVPFGRDPSGLPLGVQLIGAPDAEPRLYRIGRALEGAAPPRITP